MVWECDQDFGPSRGRDGHGERNLLGVKNHDIGEFGKQLEKKGFKFANPDLTVAQAVPSNGAMLVIASPQVNVSEVEAKKIKAYLERGGNLLWLVDDNPGTTANLQASSSLWALQSANRKRGEEDGDMREVMPKDISRIICGRVNAEGDGRAHTRMLALL